MTEPPLVTVAVVSFNTRDHLLAALASVARHAGVPHETVVVDNASTDGSVEAVRRAHPEVAVLANATNVGFGAANNQAAAVARGLHLLLLNSDAELRPGALPALVAALDRRPGAAAAGPLTREPDGTIQVSFGPMLTPLAEWRQRALVRGVRRRDTSALARAEAAARVPQEPVWVSASCLLVRKEAFAAVGGFDEGFFLYEEDVDLCVRLRAAGATILHVPEAEVVHHLGRSTARSPRAALEYHRSHLRFYRKHNGALATAALRGALAARALGALCGGRVAEARAVAGLAFFDRPGLPP